jgi:hypothetical protein
MSLKRNTGKASKDVADRAQKVLLIEKLKSLGFENVMWPLMGPEKYTIAELNSYVKSREETLEEIELRRKIREIGGFISSTDSYSLRDLKKMYKDLSNEIAAENAKMREHQRKKAKEESDQFAAEYAYLESFNFMFPRSRRVSSLPRKTSLKFRCK